MSLTTELSLDEKPSYSHNKRLSRILTLEFDDNDDIEEKKAQNKRKSVLLELGLTNNVKNKTDNFKSTTLTSDQITNHYGDCMKLSSENKITPKNAFDLHLIDYLQDHLKRLQSFQVLSSSLDAGAKIYAGRVDSVHSNTYSIFTRCDTSPEDEKPNDDMEVDKDDDIDTNIEIKIRRQKKRTDTNKKVTCTNLRKIRLTAAQIRSEVDPLFQSQTKTYDEGGTGELRLNNLKLLYPNYELLLDFESIVSTKDADCNDVFDSDFNFDISNFSEMFNELSQNQMQISTEFDNFKFTGWDRNSDTMTSQVTESLKNMMQKEMSVTDINDDYCDNYGGGDDCGGGDDYVDDYGCGDNYAGDGVNANVEGDKIDNEKVEGTLKEEVEDDMLKIGSSKNENESSLFVSSVKEMVNSFMDNYGEINDNILGMWAGPDHWKQKAKPIKLVNTYIDINKPEKTKKAKKELIPMFADKVEARRNADGIGRLVNIQKVEEEEPIGTKTHKQLTDECISKNMKKEYLLPLKSQFVLRSINQLMNRDISLVNKALKNQASQITNVHLDKDQLPSLGTETDNDVVVVNNEDMMVVDDDGNVSQYDGDCGDGGDDYYDDPYTGKSFRNCDFDDFAENAPIRAADTENINYAKTAKKINVKKLKQDIQSFLSEQIHIQDIGTIKKDVANLQKSTDFCSLNDLLVYVDKKSAPEVAKELSVSILMTCLLHLTNEAGLDIINADDYSDFSLGQGFSDYDLKQVQLFGQSANAREQGCRVARARDCDDNSCDDDYSSID